MKLSLVIVDDFFAAPDEVRSWAQGKGFKDEVSPVDGLAYKGVCKDLPWIFTHEMVAKLSYIFQAGIEENLSFVRLSLADYSKRWIHVDSMYSQMAAVVYLNVTGPPHGTRFFRHPSFNLEGDPISDEQIKIWDEDCNEPDRWIHTGEVEGVYNRCVIYPTTAFHASLPRGGFGGDSEAGRMAFVMFFNVRR